MVAVKYKKRFVIASLMLFSLYIMVTDVVPEDTGYGWIYLNSDITNNSFYRTRTLHSNDGSCTLRDSTRFKRRSVDFRIIIITYNRDRSLLRLLNSLERSYYDGDRVVIDLWIDRSKSQLVHNETLHKALTYKFNKGRCNVFVHPKHVGITGQWLSTWSPEPNSSEISVILEDDLTASPYFYRYLKLVHQKYDHRHDIYGFSLQGKSMRHSDGECCLQVPLKHNVFLYPTLGTSGFSPKTQNWLQFQAWYSKFVQDKIDVVPFIENNIAVKWYNTLKSKGKADSMWEMEYLFYTQIQNEFTLYPNFPGSRGFTFNWFEDGLHSTGVRIESHEMEYRNLVMEWSLNLDQLPDNPIYIDNSGEIIKQ